MTRDELTALPGYTQAQMQLAIYECAEKYMKAHNMNRTQLAEYLGVSKGYVTQLLSGDYNYSLSKLCELSVKLGVTPHLTFA